ncbi:hypothetical protein BS78_01G132400 [Paspalum vaginatum]|nr:hypothetical protein BS78_01G132400 [Paspalum vaginatum]
MESLAPRPTPRRRRQRPPPPHIPRRHMPPRRPPAPLHYLRNHGAVPKADWSTWTVEVAESPTRDTPRRQRRWRPAPHTYSRRRRRPHRRTPSRLLHLHRLLLPRAPLFLCSRAPGAEEQEGARPWYPMSFAQLISASSGDAPRAALYPAKEHRRLAEPVSGRGVYARAGNVWIVSGPIMLTATLHAAVALLRLRRRWDWFVNLSASDYPLITQDDLREAFAGLPRDLNFIQHLVVSPRGRRSPRSCPTVA